MTSVARMIGCRLKLPQREHIWKVAGYLQGMQMEGCEGVLFKKKKHAATHFFYHLECVYYWTWINKII